MRKIMKPNISIIFLLFCISCHADETYHDEDKVSFTESEVVLDATFGSQKGEKHTLQQIKSVEYLQAYDGHIDYLFKVSRIQKSYSGIEGDYCSSTIVAMKKGANYQYSKIWSLNNSSCGAAATSSYFETKQFGCCGAENVTSYYSLKSGKLVALGTSKPQEIPNMENLNIIYYGDRGTSFDEKDKELIGIIYLANENEVLDKIYVKSSTLLDWTPEINANSEEYFQKKDKVVTFKYEDDSMYSLIVNGNRFTIPVGSKKVFKK